MDKDQVCDICGDVGYGEVVVTCFLCKSAHEHIYCMRVYLKEIPENWVCECCLLTDQTKYSATIVDEDIAPILVDECEPLTVTDELPHHQPSTKFQDSHSMSNSKSGAKQGNTYVHRNIHTRGITIMRDLVEARMSGDRLVVHYNADGQAVGHGATKLQSYLGTLVRKLIPLTCSKWNKDVPNDLKHKIWDYLEKSFVLDPKSKHKIMLSSARKMRTFRYMLTKHIKEYKDQPEMLASPPSLYDYIPQDQWDYFLKNRLSVEFKKKSKEGTERRSRLKCPHHSSRKGYAQLAVELKLNDSTDPSYRSTLWKEARKGKNKEFVDQDTIEMVNRIDELSKVNQGRDVLTDALGTPEHRGRVRGMGNFILPSTYFKFTRPKSNMGNQPTQSKM